MKVLKIESNPFRSSSPFKIEFPLFVILQESRAYFDFKRTFVHFINANDTFNVIIRLEIEILD